MNKGFPENFLWGAATASAQIEGGYNEGGRTPSIGTLRPKEKSKTAKPVILPATIFITIKKT